MKKLLTVLFFISFCSVLNAGFVAFDCNFPDDPYVAIHAWSFTGYDAQGGVLGTTTEGSNVNLCSAVSWTLTLAETMHAVGEDSVNISGETAVDPTFHVTKTVTNSSGYAWTSYELILATGASFDYTAPANTSSDKFLTSTQTAQKLTFLSPNSVLNGETVVLNFDINVPSTGSFNFCLTQNPIPEPITVAMLGLGGLLFRRK